MSVTTLLLQLTCSSHRKMCSLHWNIEVFVVLEIELSVFQILCIRLSCNLHGITITTSRVFCTMVSFELSEDAKWNTGN